MAHTVYGSQTLWSASIMNEQPTSRIITQKVTIFVITLQLDRFLSETSIRMALWIKQLPIKFIGIGNLSIFE